MGLHERIHRRARPTGQFPRIVGVRVQPDMAKQIDDWRRKQEDLPGLKRRVQGVFHINSLAGDDASL
jgi:hypothetical protein